VLVHIEPAYPPDMELEKTSPRDKKEPAK
jgi:hypothetical protein